MKHVFRVLQGISFAGILTCAIPLMATEIREDVRPIIGKTFEGKYKLKSIGCQGQAKVDGSVELANAFLESGVLYASVEFFKSGTTRTITRYTDMKKDGREVVCFTDTIGNYYYGAFTTLEPNAMLNRDTHAKNSCDSSFEPNRGLTKSLIREVSEDRILGVSTELDEMCINSPNTFVFERER